MSNESKGGKPSKGTPADRRLSQNQPSKPAPAKAPKSGKR